MRALPKQAQACFFLLGAFMSAVLLSGCSDSDSDSNRDIDTGVGKVHQSAGPIMGSRYSVKWAGKQLGKNQDDADRMVLSELERINLLMSTYDPASELSRFNTSSPGEWFAVDRDVMNTLQVATDVSAASEGALDITIGKLVNLWGFGPEGRMSHEPGKAEIDGARALTGHDKLILDPENLQIRKTADIYVDLSSTAKGYAVDVIAELLERHGITDYLVDIGGELRMSGTKPDGVGWRIAVETPRPDSREIFQVFSFDKAAIATSGDYRNYFEENGHRFSHTIDPETGRPITHKLVSATVIAERCDFADAWATALTVLGPEAAKTHAEREGLAVMLIVKEGEEFVPWRSPVLEEMLASQI